MSPPETPQADPGDRLEQHLVYRATQPHADPVADGGGGTMSEPGTRVVIRTGAWGGTEGVVVSTRPSLSDRLVVDVRITVPVLIAEPDGPTREVVLSYAPAELEVIEHACDARVRCERPGCLREAVLDIRPAGTIAMRLVCAQDAGDLLLGWQRDVATIEVRKLRGWPAVPSQSA